MLDIDAEIESVKTTINDLVDSYSTDFEKYFSFYSNDMIMSVPDHGLVMTRQDYYDYWKVHVSEGFGAADARIEDLRLQMSPLGDAAVAYFIEPTKLRFPQGHENYGKEIIHNYINTCALFKREGQWKIVNMSVTIREEHQSKST